LKDNRIFLNRKGVKKMKKFVATIMGTVLVFLAVGFVSAQEVTPMSTLTPTVTAQTPNETEDPGILPDSPFYTLKTIWEQVQAFLARDPSKKAELYLRFAHRRLLEVQKMCEKGKCDIAERWTQRFQERIQMTSQEMEQAQKQGQDVAALVAKLQANLARQQAVLDRVIENAPEPAKDALMKAKENSARGINQAIESITKEKPAGTGQETETEEEEETGNEPTEVVKPGKGGR